MTHPGMNIMLRLTTPKESIVLVLAIFAAGCRSTDTASVVEPGWDYGTAAEYQPTLATPYEALTESPIPAQGVAQPEWPGNSEAIVFAWSGGSAEGLAKRGKAEISKAGSMKLAGGSFVAEGRNSRLLEACSQSNELTIEAVLTSHNTTQQGPARIVSFSTDHNSRNFTLGQDREKLTLRLRTSKTGANGIPPETVLTKVTKGGTMHLVVTYRPGELAAFVDGEEVFRTKELKGDFSNWEPHHLIFGDEFNGQRDWSGDLERVALFSEFTTAEAARARFLMIVE
jgi:hypothetical protein